jgi:hypothetical protein
MNIFVLPEILISLVVACRSLGPDERFYLYDTPDARVSLVLGAVSGFSSVS